MAQNAKKGFVLYYDYREHLTLLSDEERGKLLMALLNYGESHEEPNLDGAALMAFSFIRSQMDRDAEKYAKTCEKRKEAGKQGGRPSKAKAAEEGEKKTLTPPKKQTKAKKANAFSENQNEAKKADTDTNKDTDTDTDTDIIIPPNPPRGTQSDIQEKRFNEFWSEYPKKIGKKAAQNAWKKLKPDATLFDRIMQAVRTAKKSEQWKRENGRFIPNPSTWLNQGRWDDELTPTSSSSASYDIEEYEKRTLERWGNTPQPKTAGEDEAIRARAEALQRKLSAGGKTA